MRLWMAGLVLGCCLGCAGLGEQLSDLTGMEMQLGAGAVHPEDIELPPPPGAERPQAVVRPPDGSSVVVSYAIDDREEVLAFYLDWYEGRGVEPELTEQDALGTRTTVLSAPARGEVLTLSASGGQSTVTLVVQALD